MRLEDVVISGSDWMGDVEARVDALSAARAWGIDRARVYGAPCLTRSEYDALLWALDALLSHDGKPKCGQWKVDLDTGEPIFWHQHQLIIMHIASRLHVAFDDAQTMLLSADASIAHLALLEADVRWVATRGGWWLNAPVAEGTSRRLVSILRRKSLRRAESMLRSR